MAAVRELLMDTSDKLRLVLSGLRAVDEEVAALLVGVDDLPLSEAAERVSQGARTAAAVASRILKAAEVTKEAAGKAAAEVAAVQSAKAEAVAAAEAAAVAAQKAAAAAEAAAALEVKIKPSVLFDHTWQPGGSGDNIKGQGTGSSGRATIGRGHADVAVQADDSDMSIDGEEEEGRVPLNREDVLAGGSTGPETQDHENDEVVCDFRRTRHRSDLVQADDSDMSIDEEEEHEGVPLNCGQGSAGGRNDPEIQDHENDQSTPGPVEREEEVEEEEEEIDDEGGTGTGGGRGTAVKARQAEASAQGQVPRPQKCPSTRRPAAPLHGNEASNHQRKPSRRVTKAASVPSKSAGDAIAQQARERPSECGDTECTTQVGSGMIGSKKREPCSKHAKKDIVNAKDKKICGHPGCTTERSFGVVGSKKREFCSKHAKPGMVNVKDKLCGNPGCTTQPTFGMVGSKKRDFCSKHAKPGMTNVKDKMCGNPGCTTQPTFGVVGSKKKREFCFKHAKPGMTSVRI